jgi:hypothetical protein
MPDKLKILTIGYFIVASFAAFYQVIRGQMGVFV